MISFCIKNVSLSVFKLTFEKLKIEIIRVENKSMESFRIILDMQIYIMKIKSILKQLWY